MKSLMVRILKSFFLRVSLAFKVFVNPGYGSFLRPAWLDARETFDLSSDTLAGAFRNLYEFEVTGVEREWKQVLFYAEMAQKVRNVPGDVAEFGVSGGVSLMAFVRIFNVFERGLDHKERKQIFGFDSFEGLPSLHSHDKSEVGVNNEMKRGGFQDSVGYKHLVKFASSFDHVHLLKGWFSESLPALKIKNPSITFSLVHVDCDLYESTMDVLVNVWDCVSPGGVVVFDELFHKDFPGETRAFKEFFEKRKSEFTLHMSEIKPDKKYLIKL